MPVPKVASRPHGSCSGCGVTCVQAPVLHRWRTTSPSSPSQPLQCTDQVPETQEAAVLQCSGTSGLYIEPRLPDSSNPSDEYQVVWMPQATLAEAQRSMQCEPLSIGLARAGRRYGIRVQAKHYQSVFSKLKPDSQFLAPGERLNWHCGPWPFGSDRKMLAKVFGDMQSQPHPFHLPRQWKEASCGWCNQ